jgi:hypothetical protein
MNYFSSCLCESVQVTLSLPNPIESYHPRVCDCDFCKYHRLAYISDPLGKLSIKLNVSVNFLKQGSEQASFVQCSKCHQIITVIYNGEKAQRGAVSAALFANKYALGEYQSISPRLLSSSDKRERWSRLWLTVVFEIGLNT